MNPMFMLQLLWRRAQLKPRERWPRKRLLHHQQDAAVRLQSYAFARSPFYQRFHAGLEGAPLSKLPVLTKAHLMSEYDDVVTDRAIRLEDVRQHILSGDASGLFRGRYFVTATGGSTGQPAIVLHDRDEWLWVMASYARAADWAGMGFPLRFRRRHALVSSRTPWHQSSQLARTAEGPWVSTLRLDAGDPLDRILKALNDFQPHVLTAYAKTARVLAESALAGDLRISPESVACASEPLSREARQRIVEAWGVQPFDIYGATETAGMAAECEHHSGLHLFEDLVITEIVDDQNRPVPPSATGAKVLVTVLLSRTLPLIRYEMSDRLVLSERSCACGRSFALLDGVEGREEDLLWLPAVQGGQVALHPTVLSDVLEPLPIQGWQITRMPDRIVVAIREPQRRLDLSAVAERLRGALLAHGAAALPLEVQRVEELARTALGKTPFLGRDASA